MYACYSSCNSVLGGGGTVVVGVARAAWRRFVLFTLAVHAQKEISDLPKRKENIHIHSHIGGYWFMAFYEGLGLRVYCIFYGWFEVNRFCAYFLKWCVFIDSACSCECVYNRVLAYDFVKEKALIKEFMLIWVDTM